MQNYQEVIKKKHEGYAAAREVDTLIESYTKDFPLEDPNNLFFWLTFCRTIESSIGIIEQYYYDSKNKE